VSRDAYDRLVGEWLANGRRLPSSDDEGFTVGEQLAAYLRWAKRYYPPKEIAHVRIVMRAMKPYNRRPVRDFGPLALKAVRQSFVDRGHARTHVNDNVARIRRIFKWGVENELLSAGVLHALQAVSGLRRGRTDAPEGERVKPVPDEYVDAVRPYVSRQVWAIIELQRLTGMRSGEVVIMRGCDLDMTGKLWLYRPGDWPWSPGAPGSILRTGRLVGAEDGPGRRLAHRVVRKKNRDPRFKEPRRPGR
jgi:integrase